MPIKSFLKKWLPNHSLIKIILVGSGMLLTCPAKANNLSLPIQAGLQYDQAKASLIADGWTPIVNLKITRSSLYAQEIFEHGSTEVVDCISMELDACTFRYVKNKKILEVRTITRDLKVDNINFINRK